MRNVVLVALVVALVTGAALIFKPQLKETYFDYKSSNLVAKCYLINDVESGQVIGALALQSYNSETNTFNGYGVLGAEVDQISFKLEVPRESVLNSLEIGELTSMSCDGE